LAHRLLLLLALHSSSHLLSPVMSLGSGAAAGASSKKTPSDFLKSVLGRPVIVKLNSGVSYRGILACLDGYMNVALVSQRSTG